MALLQASRPGALCFFQHHSETFQTSPSCFSRPASRQGHIPQVYALPGHEAPASPGPSDPRHAPQPAFLLPPPPETNHRRLTCNFHLPLE